MRGVEVDRLERVGRALRDARGAHEVKRVRDALGHRAVALGLLAVGEAQRPGMDLVHVGVAARREGAHEVERRGGLGVGAQHPLGVGLAGVAGEGEVVDDVPAVGGKLLAPHCLERSRARLGELAAHAPDLHHRHLGAVGQHHGHLEHDLEGVADRVGRELGEALGAVAALEQERLARRRASELGPEPARARPRRRAAGSGRAAPPPRPAPRRRRSRASARGDARASRSCSKPSSSGPPASGRQG